MARRTADGVVRNFVSTKKSEENGTIYFRGAAVVDVTRDNRWIGQQSFYVRHGDWFLYVCLALSCGGYYLIRSRHPSGR